MATMAMDIALLGVLWPLMAKCVQLVDDSSSKTMLMLIMIIYTTLFTNNGREQREAFIMFCPKEVQQMLQLLGSKSSDLTWHLLFYPPPPG